MLKSYFTAAVSGNRDFSENYRRIFGCLKKNRVEILSGEQIISQKFLKRDKHLSKEKIFEREKSLIDQADFILAEVTKPSLGVGGEIVYALIKNKSVLALVYKENENKLSSMIAGNPSDNLFLEHYDFDNFQLIIKNFLNHLKKIKNQKGKLIVIEGGDGSGKATQARLLVDFFKKKHGLVKYLDFPRYYSSFHGQTIARFLRGEFGVFDQVSPYLASLAYALDRFSVKEEMETFLKKGGFIIANRYATSNMAHQTAKFTSKKEQENFLHWIYTLEYKIHKIPKENLVIYLDVPWETAATLTDKKKLRPHLKGQTHDIAEADLHHQQAAQKMYLELSRRWSHWIKIDCASHGKILAVETIHQKIIEVLGKMGYIKVYG